MKIFMLNIRINIKNEENSLHSINSKRYRLHIHHFKIFSVFMIHMKTVRKVPENVLDFRYKRRLC